MNNSWITQLHQELLRLRGSGPGWGNHSGGVPYIEPTALAALALAGSDSDVDPERSLQAVAAAAGWLATLQQRDGSLGIAPDLPQPRWTTPLGILVWSATDRDSHARKKAVDWLLAKPGLTSAPEASKPYGHDPQIPGWPWVEGTHCWLEPTAMAVLALRRARQLGHERTRDGMRLIRDRVIRTGGWNYGNSSVFGANLRPHPAPTGLALLALAGLEDADSPIVVQSCTYLEKILPTTHAPQSLCFGILALAAWEQRPAGADDWLVAAREGAARRSNSIAQLAYLLIGAGSRTLELLGLARPGREESADP